MPAHLRPSTLPAFLCSLRSALTHADGRRGDEVVEVHPYRNCPRKRPNTRGDMARRETDPVADGSDTVIGACIEVHRQLGPGLLESTYESCLCHELALRGIPFRRQVPVPLSYKGLSLDCAYRMDLVVDAQILVELKVVERLRPVHESQALTYLR